MTRRAILIIFAGALASVAGPAAAFQFAAPPPELKKLEFLVGEIEGKGKMYAPGQAPIAWTSKDKSAWVVNGLFLKMESNVTYQGLPPAEALALMSYDSKAKLYRSWAFIPFTTEVVESTGKFEGEKLVWTTKPMDFGLGQPTVARLTFEPKASGEVAYMMEVQMGGQWQKFEDGVYSKKKK